MCYFEVLTLIKKFLNKSFKMIKNQTKEVFSRLINSMTKIPEIPLLKCLEAKKI